MTTVVLHFAFISLAIGVDDESMSIQLVVVKVADVDVALFHVADAVATLLLLVKGANKRHVREFDDGVARNMGVAGLLRLDGEAGDVHRREVVGGLALGRS